MDTLTHALSGALVARATAPREQAPEVLPLGRRVAVGFLAAAFPDLDILFSFVSPLTYLYHHRGITHSLLLLPAWAFLLAWLCALVWRRGPGWRAYFGVVTWGIGAHIAGDVITAFGTIIFAPFSDTRYAISTTFIIDLWFSAIIVAGLLAALFWPNSRAPAVAGLAVLAGYVGFQYLLQQQAVEFGRSYARAAGLEQARVSALPRPVSPFNWMVVVSEGDRYYYSLISLSRREPPRISANPGFFERLAAPYLPLAQARWVQVSRFGVTPMDLALSREAWQQPEIAFFRWFAEYPVLYKVETANPETCVWFQDLRFFTPGRGSWPFRYGLCREENGSWQPFWLTDDGKRPVY